MRSAALSAHVDADVRALLSLPRDCQRQTGSAFVLNALIETDRIALLLGDPEPVAVPTDSGRPHDIYRCHNYLQALLALWVAGCAGPAVGHDEAGARTAFRTAEVALDRHSDGFFLDDDPQAPALLERQWSLVRHWTVAYLNEHPAAAEAEIASAVGGLSADLRIEAIRLDPRTVLVSASRGEMGTVFMVAAQGKRFAIAWTIADSATNDAQGADLLAAWAAARARDSCRKPPPNETWLTCGALHGAIGKLPDERDGNSRFYVDATYAQPMGATVTAQLSIWRWTGLTAEPLFAKTYDYMIDQKLGTRLDGNLLRLRVKDEFKTFFACGSCEGRQLDWTIRIDPDRIEELGKTSAVPELDLVDALYDRMLNGEPATDLASSAVVKMLESRTEIARKEAAASGDPPSLGMLMDWKVVAEGQRTKLWISTDDGGAYLFTIDTVEGKPRITTAVEDLGDAE